MHGKDSVIHHDGETVFKGLPSPLSGARYHSLVIDSDSLPASLEVSAKTEDGVIMGVRNRHDVVEGVQFHPESILTPQGYDILTNFLNMSVPVRSK
jgi:anthranilate synthase/aminodeoxychorismate synthase-like glutamine amidotransferase